MLTDILKTHKFHPIVPFNFQKDTILNIDLTENNTDLHSLDLLNVKVMDEYVSQKIKDANAVCAVGGYLENRYIYRTTKHFQQSAEPRSIHLGVDVWAKAGTPVYAPMQGKVHSFANNDNIGDYGPTIILEHILEGETFYTLYGHLNLECLEGLYVGKNMETGDKIAEFGNYPINGNWSPHLHFQVITDMLEKKGDFPGVCEPSKTEYFKKICLDGNLVLM
jgi:murein DD-endopeptidase MepM/ murein hydrolase activator NlpD